jgi:hypothetical protein
MVLLDGAIMYRRRYIYGFCACEQPRAIATGTLLSRQKLVEQVFYYVLKSAGTTDSAAEITMLLVDWLSLSVTIRKGFGLHDCL